MIRKATAVWKGTGRDGTGQLSSESGVLAATPYSFKTRFENEKGTNPEELIAAAHAGCFTMALAFGLQLAGFTPDELTTEAAVSLEPEGKGFKISKSALTLRAKVPNLDDAGFAKIAGEAEKNCPVSKVLNARNHARREADVRRAQFMSIWFCLGKLRSSKLWPPREEPDGQMPGFRLGRRKHRMRRVQNGQTDQLGVEI